MQRSEATSKRFAKFFQISPLTGAMATSLHSAQQRSLRRFLLVYYLVITIVAIGFGLLYYHIRYDALQEAAYHALKERGFTITSAIIDAQMHGGSFTPPKDICIIGRGGKILQKGLGCKRLIRDFSIQEGTLYYQDRGAKGHLGIDAIILQDRSFAQKKQRLLLKTLFIFVISYLLLALVGIYLGRLFLRPIRMQLEQLDRFIKDSTHELNTQ